MVLTEALTRSIFASLLTTLVRKDRLSEVRYISSNILYKQEFIQIKKRPTPAFATFSAAFIYFEALFANKVM